MFSHVGTTTPESVLSERAEDDPAMTGGARSVARARIAEVCVREIRAPPRLMMTCFVLFVFQV
jgi:hypothetical protein